MLVGARKSKNRELAFVSIVDSVNSDELARYFL